PLRAAFAADSAGPGLPADRGTGGGCAVTAQRFFRRYFLTGIGLILLFLVANGVMLLGLSMAIDRVSAFRAPLDELAACVQAEGGGYRVRQAEITALLEGSGLPWAMVLDAEGGVVWSWQL